ncbi:hypothetical protein ABZY06_33920 [Streptomyces sp. NPDC006540]|uniref:hypothetical protein n=1 Tax=Streptomyces sp. NPDC006540 TaxID=3155353 RepID=UPI0033B92ECF
MGVATPIAGNLLSFNTQSMETDATGWQLLGTGSTLARVGIELTSTSGSFAMRGTSTAAATTLHVTTAAAVAVTAGTEYLAYLWSWSGVGGSTSVEVGIRWLDATATHFATSRQYWTIPAGGSARRLAVLATAPAGAVTAKVYVQTALAAIGDNYYFDQVYLGVPPNAADNLLTFNEYSTELSLPPWTATNATMDMSFKVISPPHYEGSFSAGITPSGPGFITAALDRLIPVTPGQLYRTSGVLWGDMMGDTSRTLSARTYMDWYDAGGNLLLRDNPDQFFTFGGTAAGSGGITLGQTRMAPVGAAFGRFAVEIDHTSSTMPKYFLDICVFKPSTAEYDISVNNAAGLVTFTYYATPNQGMTGFYSVDRIHEDGSVNPVRGYSGDVTMLPFDQLPVVVEDYEAPLDQVCWYLIKWHNGTLTTQRRGTQTFRSPVLPDGNYVWVKSPGVPALNTQVLMEAPLKWTRVARSAALSIVGRTNPIHVTGKRAGRTGSLSVLIWDASVHDMFNSLMDSGAALLLQAMPGYGLQGNLYLSVGDVEADPITGAANEPGWRWTMAVTEIDRPVGGIQGSALSTWNTILSDLGYADWGDVMDAHDTWADVLLIEP